LAIDIVLKPIKGENKGFWENHLFNGISLATVHVYFLEFFQLYKREMIKIIFVVIVVTAYSKPLLGGGAGKASNISV